MHPIKLCIVGAGQFSQCFVPLFKAHPLVGEVSIAETIPHRLCEEADRLGITRRFASFEEVLASDVDAVAIFTQRWMHAPMSIAALRAGKHVYSAVPAGIDVDEIHQLVETVEVTGQTYMMGETSLYYPARLYCANRFAQGDFGRFVYGEGEYLHDMSHGFYAAFEHSGGERWKRTAGFPPMLYPTHSVSMVLAVTGARMTHVSCVGVRDDHEDGIFCEGANDWDNPFSNQSALFQTSDGGMARINEFRRIGHSGGRSVRLSLFGTEGSFEEHSGGAVWTDRKGNIENLDDLLRTQGVYGHEQWQTLQADPSLFAEFSSGLAKVHAESARRLPDSFRNQPNGHEGSHQFLVDDFATAIAYQRRPPVSVWDAARYNLPGIIAHQSALRDGERLAVPDFGDGIPPH